MINDEMNEFPEEGVEDVLTEKIKKIKDGDSLLREELIKQYRPFIKKVISTNTRINRYIEDSDEYSIGLIAFNEAIECYNDNKGSRFIRFAKQVIKRRLIDYLRSTSRKNCEMPFSSIFDESTSGFQVEEVFTDIKQSNQFVKIEIIYELNKYKEILGSFGIKISELPECMPKHNDSRELCISIAKELSENLQMIGYFERTKNIPVSELSLLASVHRKTIQRHRKYIIAITIVLSEKFEHIRSFILDSDKKEKKNEV